jgi:signal transduction histidine kinase
MQIGASPSLLPVLLVALTMAIFIVDALTPLDIAIAVMYVVVVLLSSAAWRRRGVIATTLVCMLLTLAAYLASHMDFSASAFGRLVVSLAAIGITAFLVLKAQQAARALENRENSLRRSEAQLAHVTRVTTLGELAASIAHEVNQPLAAISANGQACLRWLGRAQPDLDEARAAVTRLLEASGRATEVIQRIRALARKSDPQHKPLDLNGVATEVLDLVRRELERHDVRAALQLAPSLPRVHGDRVQLQQVIINLLMNGMQAMAHCAPGGATLTLATALADDGGAVRLCVADTGQGIAAAQMPRLFEAFFTTKEDGMGMGLPICRSIIEAHGGRIWAESPAGAGATVCFTLPVLDEAAPARGVLP